MREKLNDYIEGFWAVLPQLIASLIFVLLVWVVAALVRAFLPRILRRARTRNALIEVSTMLLTVLIWFFGLLIAATIAFPTITPGKALTALGVGGIAIGLAFKDTFENFFAGVLVLLREPFTRGDFIECEGIEGQVELVTVRDTRLRQTDGQLVVTPNGFLFKNPVTVRTSKDLRRTTIICGVAYGEDVDAARDVIAEAVRKVDLVHSDVKDVQIYAHEFADSSINFEITWWTGSTPLDIRQSRDKVIAAVKRALDDAEIEIPFPYRTLTFKDPLRTRAENGKDSERSDEDTVNA
ncbi:mechanosensitive ion channel family protein [Roseovarius pelagicus]|uniref:Small-conductance mechanosensitive channel n=1 Tax=Roseovarius pelagicus TaxID=2980108 RepID=A0ABY6DFZ4_9RHOB|nr:mechanosensitive ion channel family protein [Roseovarius pelagicus]UXX85079.1 mechanosensitive ion channel family protein [Roseovarius pelagicus]